MDSLVLVAAVLAAGLRLATPIALAAIGETLAQRTGVINVGIEGIMLVGAENGDRALLAMAAAVEHFVAPHAPHAGWC